MKRMFMAALCAGALLAPRTMAAGETPQERTLQSWLDAYDRTFTSKDVEGLHGFYAPNATVIEEGTVSRGWVEYRDGHLLPELRRLQAPVLFHVHFEARSLDKAEDTVLLIAEYRLRAEVAGRLTDTRVLETLVVVKYEAGAWKILHAHRSPES